MSLDDSDFKAIAAEMREELDGTAVTILGLEDQHNALLEITGEVLDENDCEEIAAEIKADQDMAAVLGEREVGVRERLIPHEREIEDLRQKLARKEGQEETAWAVWGTAFLLLICATIVTGIFGFVFNNAFLVELALFFLLIVIISFAFPEVVVRTLGVTKSGIWQRLFNRPSHPRDLNYKQEK